MPEMPLNRRIVCASTDSGKSEWKGKRSVRIKEILNIQCSIFKKIASVSDSHSAALRGRSPHANTAFYREPGAERCRQFL
jgi:hypothetical protein